MGLITGLLTLPVAPLRGTVKVAEILKDEAEARMTDPERIREELEHVERLRQEGAITEQEALAWEDELIDRLTARELSGAGGSP